MELTLESGKSYENPDTGMIELALRTLDGDANGYAILSHEYEIYMQVSGGPTEGFRLEYRDGSEDKHFQTAREDLTLDDIVEAFTRYAKADESWRSLFEWKPLDMTQLIRKPGKLMILIPFVGIFVAWLISKFVIR